MPATARRVRLRTRVLQIRLTEAEAQVFNHTAEIAGIGASSWARERLRTSAIRELESAGISAEVARPLFASTLGPSSVK